MCKACTSLYYVSMQYNASPSRSVCAGEGGRGVRAASLRSFTRSPARTDKDKDNVNGAKEPPLRYSGTEIQYGHGSMLLWTDPRGRVEEGG